MKLYLWVWRFCRAAMVSRSLRRAHRGAGQIRLQHVLNLNRDEAFIQGVALESQRAPAEPHDPLGDIAGARQRVGANCNASARRAIRAVAEQHQATELNLAEAPGS
jgi:hypothetical protein